MSHNPDMTSTERVLWRTLCQAAFIAARDPTAVGKAKAMKKALGDCRERRMPDLRPLPAACFRAFVTVAHGFVAETDPGLRLLLAPRLEALSDAAGDILDGLRTAGEAKAPAPLWTERADLK